MFSPLTLITPTSAKQVLQSTKRTIMMGDNTMWLVVDSNTHGLAQIYQFLDLLKYSWSIDETLFANIHTAVSEAITNAAEHGNKWEEKKSVYLCATRDGQSFTFTIEDEGDGFNYRKIENPTDQDKRSKPGGRGIFIMNYLSDHIQFSESGKCVKLFFHKKE